MEAIQKTYEARKASLETALKEGEQILSIEPVNTKTLKAEIPRISRCLERFLESSDKLIEKKLKATEDNDIMDLELEQSNFFGHAESIMGDIADVLKQQKKIGDEDLVSTAASGHKSHHHRLPKLELPKFGGEARDWLQFWSAFQTVHEDDSITSSVKFQYLVNCMEVGSPSQEIVSSYPITNENYTEVIKSLKERFGREDMLVEVYVRDLLSLILENAANKTGISFSSLFVRLSSQLRALGSLGVTTDKCAAILFPMVESALPEDILVAWGRTRHQQPVDGKNTSESQLEKLMEFLKHEVEGNERIRLARQPFSSSSSHTTKKEKERGYSKPAVPTAATFVAFEAKSNGKPTCVFCDGKHSSEACCKAMSMSLEDRRKTVQEKKRCYACLKPNHSVKKCREMVKCISCGKKHWAILCPDIDSNKSEKDKKGTETSKKDSTTVDMCNHLSLPDVPLPTVAIRIHGNNKTKVVRAMLDSGSQRSYILKKTAKELGVQQQGRRETIHILFGGHTEKQKHYRYKIQLSSLDSKYIHDFEVDDHPELCNTIPEVKPGRWLKELRQKGIELSDWNLRHMTEIEVMLGNDVFGKLLTGNKIDLESGLTTLETVFGWTLSGPLPEESTSSVLSYHVRDLNIQDLWNLDVIGITEPLKEKSKGELQQAALDFFENTVKRNVDGRYVINLPWIEGHAPIPSYRVVSEKKLLANTARLKKLGVLEAYHQVFKTWEEEGIIERIHGGTGHYLSHHGVIKPESTTTPVRPVFNASFCSKRNASLNSCLEIGPNMLEEIPAIITRFRLGLVGVTSDIKKAFLQIEVAEKDRDYVRCLWYKDETFSEVQEFRHCRVVFGVNSSPFLLQATLNYHLNRSPAELQTTAELLKKSFYVDNCCASLSSLEEALEFKKNSTALLADAMMDLRGWEMGPSQDDKDVPLLGLTWNLKDDTLVCDIKSALKKLEDKSVTKRRILSIAHSIFDPIGHLCAFTIIPKMLLQQACKIKAGWDTPLPEDISKKFTSWSNQIPEISTMKIPRCVVENQNKETWSLHIFTDSSIAAFSACAFLRTGFPGQIAVNLIMARSRVAPLKDTTIPRLELIGCSCGAHLAEKVKEILDFPNIPVCFWTDSTTALAWIKNDKKWSVFVTSRVTKIRNITNIQDWRHVPGKLNPADIPSRGASAQTLLESKWWEGPSWLKLEESTWPRTVETENKEEINQELHKSIVCHVNLESSNLLIKLNRFSDFHKIIRIVVYIRRFISWIQLRGKPEKQKELRGIITYEEMQQAETKIIHLIQKVNFNSIRDDKLKTHHVFQDENGLIRMKTKLFPGEGLDLSCPVVLPSKDDTVEKLIWKEHILNCHAGVQMLQTHLRERYWILSGRRTIRGAIKSCAKCRRYRAQPLQAPEGPLPKDRVMMGAAFNVVGVDMAGPLFTKNKKKVWIAIFTCATYRAVHLELCSSLTTEKFIGALRRFVSHRGRPSVIYSDNGLNFVGCNNYLKKVTWTKVVEYANVTQIKWKFNPPTAAWWGGFWERMIGIVKQLLRSVLGSSRVTSEELQTLLCDVESVVNNRPLTYVSEEEEDLVPLTPNKLIHNCGSTLLPDVDLVEREQLVSHYRNIQHCRDEMRSRFQKEYIAMLVHNGKSRSSREVKVGEVVLIGNDLKKRIDWPMGVVVELFPSPDGNVRMVRVKTATGVFLRPIQRLFPLEINKASK